MTANEIRKTEIRADWTNVDENIADSIFQMLREIAAQLAELNAKTEFAPNLERIASALEGLERR